ncbi:MAG TPA: hypothetical protein VNL98_03255 [Gemmatimonadales bacterium]|nr:hypothetical protein [Gemmatimonadales bacterium]
MKDLHIGHGFRLPLETATETVLIVGKRGSGKSSTATRFAEQLIDARVPVAVLDPVDVWWGLKAGADGRREGGKEVYVFGGRHADLPLEPTAGELMADVLVDHRINAVMVLREFSNREKAQFAAAFADRLYRRNTEVLQLIVEEAHELMPQQPFHGEEEMLGRMLRLQKLGRTSGIGMTSITQRPASLNKNATTQAEILIAHRLIGPQDVRAVEEWIRYHHQEGLKQQVLSTLPELKTGEAWVWAPDFPEKKPIGLQRVRILEPETFDSRRTPKPGEKRAEPKQLAPVDLERLGEKMAATRERAKQEDPKHLRAEIARLRTEVARASQTRTPEPVTVTVPIVDEAHLRRFEVAAERIREGVAALRDFAGDLYGRADEMKQAVERVLQDVTRANGVRSPAAVRLRTKEAVASTAVRQRLREHPVTATTREGAVDSLEVGRGEQAVLTAIAQYPDGVTREQLTVLTGYKRSSRDTYVQRLQQKSLVETRGGRIVATDQGLRVLGPNFEPLPTGSALLKYWLRRLPEGERKVLEVVASHWPAAVDREVISEATGYKRSSRDTYIQRLSARELVVSERGTVKASDLLFD